MNTTLKEVNEILKKGTKKEVLLLIETVKQTDNYLKDLFFESEAAQDVFVSYYGSNGNSNDVDASSYLTCEAIPESKYNKITSIINNTERFLHLDHSQIESIFNVLDGVYITFKADLSIYIRHFNIKSIENLLPEELLKRMVKGYIYDERYVSNETVNDYRRQVKQIRKKQMEQWTAEEEEQLGKYLEPFLESMQPCIHFALEAVPPARKKVIEYLLSTNNVARKKLNHLSISEIYRDLKELIDGVKVEKNND